ncbi:hypothetical protein C8R47DRAFT_303596 [Mycena vitilis]|nr:hypothetical protein C8R47DRAFT_303596 [Mycena vitilis]
MSPFRPSVYLLSCGILGISEPANKPNAAASHSFFLLATPSFRISATSLTGSALPPILSSAGPPPPPHLLTSLSALSTPRRRLWLFPYTRPLSNSSFSSFHPLPSPRSLLSRSHHYPVPLFLFPRLFATCLSLFLSLPSCSAHTHPSQHFSLRSIPPVPWSSTRANVLRLCGSLEEGAMGRVATCYLWTSSEPGRGCVVQIREVDDIGLHILTPGSTLLCNG